MRIQVKNWQMNLQMVCNKKIITSNMKSDMEIKKRMRNMRWISSRQRILASPQKEMGEQAG